MDRPHPPPLTAGLASIAPNVSVRLGKIDDGIAVHNLFGGGGGGTSGARKWHWHNTFRQWIHVEDSVKKLNIVLAAAAFALLVAPSTVAAADVPELCILTGEPHVGQPFPLTVYDNQPNKVGQVSFFDNQYPIGGSALIDGKATITWTPQAAGVRWISVTKYKDGVNVGGGAREIEVKPATCGW